MNKIEGINFKEYRINEKLGYFLTVNDILKQNDYVEIKAVKDLLDGSLSIYTESMKSNVEKRNIIENHTKDVAGYDALRREAYLSLYKLIKVTNDCLPANSVNADYTTLLLCFKPINNIRKTQSEVSGCIQSLITSAADKQDIIKNCGLTANFDELTTLQEAYQIAVRNRNASVSSYESGVNYSNIEVCRVIYTSVKNSVEALSDADTTGVYSTLAKQISTAAEAFRLKIALKRAAEKKAEQAADEKTTVTE